MSVGGIGDTSRFENVEGSDKSKKSSSEAITSSAISQVSSQIQTLLDELKQAHNSKAAQLQKLEKEARGLTTNSTTSNEALQKIEKEEEKLKKEITSEVGVISQLQLASHGVGQLNEILNKIGELALAGKDLSPKKMQTIMQELVQRLESIEQSLQTISKDSDLGLHGVKNITTSLKNSLISLEAKLQSGASSDDTLKQITQLIVGPGQTIGGQSKIQLTMDNTLNKLGNPIRAETKSSSGMLGAAPPPNNQVGSPQHDIAWYILHDILDSDLPHASKYLSHLFGKISSLNSIMNVVNKLMPELAGGGITALEKLMQFHADGNSSKNMAELRNLIKDLKSHSASFDKFIDNVKNELSVLIEAAGGKRTKSYMVVNKHSSIMYIPDPWGGSRTIRRSWTTHSMTDFRWIAPTAPKSMVSLFHNLTKMSAKFQSAQVKWANLADNTNQPNSELANLCNSMVNAFSSFGNDVKQLNVQLGNVSNELQAKGRIAMQNYQQECTMVSQLLSTLNALMTKVSSNVKGS